MHAFHFDDQYQTFHSYGYAVAPGAQVHVGDISALERNQGDCLAPPLEYPD